MSFDILQEKIREKKNPTVAGLDARIEYVPAHIQKRSYEEFGETLAGAADAVWQFNRGLIDALYDVVPAVKPQAAYYENLGWAGMVTMEKTIRYAQEKGLYVIADIKRGDIGTTATAYAEAWLGVTKVGDREYPRARRRLRYPQRLHGLRRDQALPRPVHGPEQVRPRAGQDLQPLVHGVSGHGGRGPGGVRRHGRPHRALGPGYRRKVRLLSLIHI